MSTNPNAPAGQAVPHHGEHLYVHTPHQRETQNANVIDRAERAAGTLNQKIAVGLTSIFQAMPTFWAIIAWFVLWIGANATIAHFDPLPWPLLLTLASIPQLPLMIVIMVGQGLLGRKQEIQSEEQYNTTLNTYSDIKQVMQHLSAQDGELLKQTRILLALLRAAGTGLDDPDEGDQNTQAAPPAK